MIGGLEEQLSHNYVHTTVLSYVIYTPSGATTIYDW